MKCQGCLIEASSTCLVCGWLGFFLGFHLIFIFFFKSWFSKWIKMQPMITKKINVDILTPKLTLLLSVGGECWLQGALGSWCSGVFCVLSNPAKVFWWFCQAVPSVPSLLFHPRDSVKLPLFAFSPFIHREWEEGDICKDVNCAGV